MKRPAALALAIGLGAALRAPFWVEALRMPPDADTSIIGLMARHHGLATSMWGQPYGSPVEAWLAEPFMLCLGPNALAMRVLYFALGLALVPLAYLIGEALAPEAALPAALLVACPPSYMHLIGALPPPLYPATLALGGLALWLALRAGAGLERGERPAAAIVLWGVVSGLALWTHLMAASVIAISALYLLRRATRHPWLVTAAVLGLFAASAPFWLSELRDAQIWHVLRVSGRGGTLSQRLGDVVPQLHVPLGGLLGAHVPVMADTLRQIDAAMPVALAIAFAYAISLGLALRAARRSAGARVLLGACVLALVVFVIPARSGIYKTRFLTPLYLPLTVLVAWAWTVSVRRSRIALPLAVLAGLNLVGAAQLRAAWHAADATQLPLGFPDIDAVRELLEGRGVARGFAGYEMAYRLTFASDERTIVSQPWNERFRRSRLPYLDEVRFAHGVAWILTSAVASRLPEPRAFEEALGRWGAGFKATRVGAAIVYYDFVPPFAPGVVALDPPASGATLKLAAPLALDALTILGQGSPGAEPVVDVEWSSDGTTFERVPEARPGALTWANGHPEPLAGSDVVAIPLEGRVIAALRLSGLSQDWPVRKVLLHPAQDPALRRPWAEWLDPRLTWSQRRAALSAAPQPDCEDWIYRTMLAERH